jgi:Ca-activated chloride channel family protein
MDLRRHALRWIFVFPAVLALAQQPAQFRSQVTEVMVPVTVTNEKGLFVSDLEKSDFTILDEGKEQTISYFSREPNQPVVVGLLMDLSSNSRVHWKDYQESASELIFTLAQNNKRYAGYLIGYGNVAELRVNTTPDPEKIAAAIKKLSPSGGSALFDAIYMACSKERKLVEGEPRDPRSIIIIVGDGHDNASQWTLEQVIEIAQRKQVTIYGISTDAYGFDNEYRKNLVRLAESTGGKVEYPLMNVYNDVSGFLSEQTEEGNYQLKLGTGQYTSKITSAIIHSITNITGEVTTQYVLRFVPDATDDPKVERKLEVKVKLPGAIVRARTEYYPYIP